MLNIYIDDCLDTLPDEYECYVSDYFDDVYEPEWFSDKFVQRIIREIDNSEVQLQNGLSVNILNGVLGNIPPQHLSSGCKSLILLYKDNIKINGDRMGDNCISLLLEIATIKDVYISLGHIPQFPDKFDAIIVNNGQIISSMKEFVSWKVRLS